MTWGSNPVTPPASVGVEAAGGWSGTPTVKAPIIGAGWSNFRKEYPLFLSGSGALSATLLAKPRVSISFSGSGNLVPGKTQKYSRTIIFGNQDRSGTGLISGFSAWTYLKKPYPVSFSGSGKVEGFFPELDGFKAVVDRSYYPRDMPEVSVGTFTPTVYQKYSVPVAFTGTGNALHTVIGDNDGLKGILGAAYAYLETSNGTLAANAYALFGIPFVNNGVGTLSFSARMYLLQIASAFNSIGTLSAATIARRFTDYVEGSNGILSATAVGQMVRSVVLSGSGSFSSLARMYSFNQSVGLSGAGNISVTTLMKMFINASEYSQGTFSATTLMRMLRAAGLSGDGSFFAAAIMRMATNYVENADGVLSAAVIAQMVRSAALSGNGALTPLARMYLLNKAVSLSGSGQVSATTLMKMLRSAALSGNGTLSSLARIGIVNITTGLSSSGSLTSLTRLYRLNISSGLSSAGSLAATRSQIYTRSLAFSGAGNISATRSQIYTRTFAFSGAGSLSATAATKYFVTANFSGAGAVSALADFPVTAAVTTTYTTAGTFTYNIPYWAKKLDVAVLGGGGSGDVGGAGFNTGAGGGQATWQTTTLTRGSSFLPWTMLTATARAGTGGAGPAAFGISNPGESSYVFTNINIISAGGITYNRLASGHGQAGDSAVGITFSETSLPGGTGGTGNAGNAGVYGSGGAGGNGVLLGSTAGGSGSRGYVFIKAYQ